VDSGDSSAVHDALARAVREGVLRSYLAHPDGRRRDSIMYSLLPGELRGA